MVCWMDKHIFSIVSDYDRWLVALKSVVYASMATTAVGIILHHLDGNVLPVSSGRDECVSVEYTATIVRYQMTGAPL